MISCQNWSGSDICIWGFRSQGEQIFGRLNNWIFIIQFFNQHVTTQQLSIVLQHKHDQKLNNPILVNSGASCSLYCNFWKMLAIALCSHGLRWVPEAECFYFEVTTHAFHFWIRFLISENEFHPLILKTCCDCTVYEMVAFPDASPGKSQRPLITGACCSTSLLSPYTLVGKVVCRNILKINNTDTDTDMSWHVFFF